MSDTDHLISTQGHTSNSLLRFSTNDPLDFSEQLSAIAPSINCSSARHRPMKAEICGTELPGMGIFSSRLQNFRIQSDAPPFYGITIPISGHCQFLSDGKHKDFHRAKVHIQHPDKEFDVHLLDAPFDSLQLCFDDRILNSMIEKLLGYSGQKINLLESLDLASPHAQSFTRHATFIWSEILRGGPVTESALIAQESVNLLGVLLASAANPKLIESSGPNHQCGKSVVRRAENYLMENLTNPISIADVAEASGMSARTLSREFRRHQGTTVKAFVKARRLEAVNRTLLASDPDKTNVTQVALDFGFDQLGRFSGDYRKSFGELPSETLRR